MVLLDSVGRRSKDNDLGDFVNLGGLSLNGYERNCLYRNLENGSSYRDLGYVSTADRIEDGRSVASLDIENDGDLDLVIENYNQPARLLVNQGTPGNHWIQLRLVGAGPGSGGSNRSAIGARATVDAGGKVFRREVSSSGGYLTGLSHALHFGLGAATSIDGIKIHWPSGHVQEISSLAVDEVHRIEEPGWASAALAD